MIDTAFVYGPCDVQGIVGVEPRDRQIEIFTQASDGRVTSFTRPYRHWLLTNEPVGSEWAQLKGGLHYQWMRTFRTKRDLWDCRKRLKDSWCAFDDKEAAMLLGGFTYYRGLKLEDVGVLGFDIEATTLDHGPDAKVLLISNTFRRGSVIERRLFSHDDYQSEAEMFDAWSAWVRGQDPSIIVGYNCYDYDWPYLQYCAEKAGTTLVLGRDGSDIQFNRFESKFRKDGSQFYTYTGVNCYGRELIDGLFLAHKYDQAARKYENYRLKNVVAQEGLEVEGRQHYDAALIAQNYKDPTEWAKIKAYAEHDADDALSLFYLMAPAYFYLARSVPKSFQAIINSASGSQVNAFLVRSYLTEGHSIPKASDAVEYEGAISIGNPGVYRNVFKADVASLYPSIILSFKIEDPTKDPLGHFQKMMQFFTAQRLEHKRLGKTDRYYKDMSEAEKVIANSGYGFLGASGLNFNYPEGARRICDEGRAILQGAMKLTTGMGFSLVNADTDSVTVTDKGTAWTDFRRTEFLKVLNSNSPPGIRWEDDDAYEAALVLKAKNYLFDRGLYFNPSLHKHQYVVKGSAFKGAQKERALKEFMQRLTAALLTGSPAPESVYEEYVREILHLEKIERWSSKKTVTEKVLYPERTNEQRILDALDGTEREGDKVMVYFTPEGSLKRADEWKCDHDPYRLLKKLHDTVKIFKTVLDPKRFPNYSLKGQRKNLEKFLRPQVYTNTQTS